MTTDHQLSSADIQVLIQARARSLELALPHSRRDPRARRSLGARARAHPTRVRRRRPAAARAPCLAPDARGRHRLQAQLRRGYAFASSKAGFGARAANLTPFGKRAMARRRPRFCRLLRCATRRTFAAAARAGLPAPACALSCARTRAPSTLSGCGARMEAPWTNLDPSFTFSEAELCDVLTFVSGLADDADADGGAWQLLGKLALCGARQLRHNRAPHWTAGGARQPPGAALATRARRAWQRARSTPALARACVLQ